MNVHSLWLPLGGSLPISPILITIPSALISPVADWKRGREGEVILLLLAEQRKENEIQSTFALVLSPCCSSCSLKSLTSAAGSLASAPQPSYSLCWCRTSVVCSLLCLLATLYSVMQPWSAFSKWLRGGKWERCWNRKGEKESKHSCAIPFPSLSCFSRLHSQIAHFAP